MMARLIGVLSRHKALQINSTLQLTGKQGKDSPWPIAASGSVGGRRETLRLLQVRFTESVTMVTDPKFELPLSLEWNPELPSFQG